MAPPRPRRPRLLRILGVILAVGVVVGVSGYQVWPYRGLQLSGETPPPLDSPLTHEQAVADIEFAYASIRDRHMCTAHGVPPATEQRYQQVLADLPEHTTVLDVWRGAARLANSSRTATRASTTPMTIKPVAHPYTGKVYVLTSAATFSSAVIFTDLMQDNHLATVVGQSPSNNPNSCGEVIPLRLPISRLRWIMTFKYFERASGDTEPGKPLAPDIVTAPGAELDAIAADS